MDLSVHDRPHVMHEDFRRDPEAHRLRTPSGKIEIYSEKIADFALADCPGHPVWLEPFEWLGHPSAAQYPLHLLSDQPERRLHSQLDHSPYSRAGKVSGREPIYINTLDAKARGIASGDLVLVRNERGRSLAGAIVTDDMMPGVVRLATGSWYDRPTQERTSDVAFDNNANPNSLTLDRGASSFSQGCSAQTCLVEVERFVGVVPPSLGVRTARADSTESKLSRRVRSARNGADLDSARRPTRRALDSSSCRSPVGSRLRRLRRLPGDSTIDGTRPGGSAARHDVPSSSIRPPSKTRIRSRCAIVDRRCAITITVLSAIASSSAAWMACSVSESRLDVASSRINTGAFFRDHPGNGDSLALAARQLDASFADLGVIATGDRGDELIGVGPLRRASTSSSLASLRRSECFRAGCGETAWDPGG